jgi:superfamily II DNA/RNA helicase
LYENADLTSTQLAKLMTTLLVKRLESSFKAFKDSLHNLRKSTNNMIRTYEKGKIFIAPDLDINRLVAEGLTDDEIEMKIVDISDEKPGNKIFAPDDFDKHFIKGLKKDWQTLDKLCQRWDKIDRDPKFESFLELLEGEFLDRKINPTGKLIVFSEAKSTTDYLYRKLKENGYNRILKVSADNRNEVFDTVLANFDANYQGSQKNDIDILITTEVLAEGINLHRANVIVNYDTPWNATKLMQRVGRVNRIGTKSDTIYNYNFYPSDVVDAIISLKKKALVKLQGFHSTFGEDSQIYSHKEVIEQFELYEKGYKGEEDVRLKYLEFIRNFKENNIEDFRRIKNFPLKARTFREAKDQLPESSVCFLRTDDKKELYRIESDGNIKGLGFDEAVKLFEAKESDEFLGELPAWHYKQVNIAKQQYQKDVNKTVPENAITDQKDAHYNRAARYLKDIKRIIDSEEMDDIYHRLHTLMEEGTYANLLTDINRVLMEKSKPVKAKQKLVRIVNKYGSRLKFQDEKDEELDRTLLEPEIIISESFK